MSIFPGRISVVAAAGLLFFLADRPAARALVLDWDSVTWSPGFLSNSYDLNGDTVDDITVSVTSRQANIWTNDPGTGNLTPSISQTMTGGLVPVQNSLILAANLKTQSDVTIQLTFSGGNGPLNTPGANNVSFTIFDIDITTNSDVISDIYGVAPDGTHVAATLTNIGPTVTLTGTGLNQVLTGNAAAANNSGNGNVTVSFGSTLITDVFLTFSNTSGAPRYQDIGIGDITFTPVPEVNPAMTAVGSCLMALGLTFVARRRAKNNASRSHSAQS